MSQQNDHEDLGSETLARIRERTLRAENKQLHMRKPHNIIPEIKEIIEEEIPE